MTEFILARILYLALALLASDDGDGSIFLRVALIARASTCVNTNAMQPRTKVTCSYSQKNKRSHACSQRSEFSDFSLLVLPVYMHIHILVLPWELLRTYIID